MQEENSRYGGLPAIQMHSFASFDNYSIYLACVANHSLVVNYVITTDTRLDNSKKETLIMFCVVSECNAVY